MVNNSKVFNQIAFSLAKHYECVYYVNLDTSHYIVFTDSEATGASEFPSEGDDFFADCLRNVDKFIHPDDIDLMTETYEKEIMLKALMKEGSQRVSFRALNDGKMIHMRHIVLLCDDKKHMVCCLENIEKEGEYPVYWEVISSDENEIVILFRSYTGAQIRYYIDPVLGDTYVTEFVPQITNEEEKTDEEFNIRDYLD